MFFDFFFGFFFSFYDNQLALQLALGNLDINDKTQVDTFDPNNWTVNYWKFYIYYDFD